MPSCPYCRHTIARPAERPTACEHCSREFTNDADWFWILERYHYPVNLSVYPGAADFQPNFFHTQLAGDRDSTRNFEDRFRNALHEEGTPAGAFLEVIFWKMFSNGMVRNKQVNAVRAHLEAAGTERLRDALRGFVDGPTEQTANTLIQALGYGSDVIAAAFTFPAFADPHRFPMVDRRIAQWVNDFGAGHEYEGVQLEEFVQSHTTLRMEAFAAYMRWVEWARTCAVILGRLQPEVDWRARDVEMVCFTSYEQDLPRLPEAQGEPG